MLAKPTVVIISIHVNQIIMLYTLNLYSQCCQSLLNKTVKNKSCNLEKKKKRFLGIESLSISQSAFNTYYHLLWQSHKESTCQCKRHKRLDLIPEWGRFPWSKKWQPTPVFLPGKFHGQRSLVGYSPWGHKELDMTEHVCTHGEIHSFDLH